MARNAARISSAAVIVDDRGITVNWACSPHDLEEEGESREAPSCTH